MAYFLKKISFRSDISKAQPAVLLFKALTEEKVQNKSTDTKNWTTLTLSNESEEHKVVRVSQITTQLLLLEAAVVGSTMARDIVQQSSIEKSEKIQNVMPTH